MSSPYSRDPAGNRCWRYVLDICVMIRGPWVYLECLKEALDGAFALGVGFAPFHEERAVYSQNVVLLSLSSAKALNQCRVKSRYQPCIQIPLFLHVQP